MHTLHRLKWKTETHLPEDLHIHQIFKLKFPKWGRRHRKRKHRIPTYLLTYFRPKKLCSARAVHAHHATGYIFTSDC